jgi:hypothetical protein
MIIHGSSSLLSCLLSCQPPVYIWAWNILEFTEPLSSLRTGFSNKTTLSFPWFPRSRGDKKHIFLHRGKNSAETSTKIRLRLFENDKNARYWWFIPVISAPQKAEAE